MRHPFWILNSVLVFLIALLAGYLYLSYQTPLERTEIEAAPVRPVSKKSEQKIIIERIYENDIFGTTPRKVIKEESAAELVQKMPEPPRPVKEEAPPEAEVTFLDPLPIKLRGIMTFALDDSKNRAVIEASAGNEALFRVGDMIEDAQLLRIFANKIIIIRSNGQQEVLYLREKDALLDPTYANALGWNDVVKQISPSEFSINVSAFTTRVTNISQLLDMLDITTIYQKGENFGCRIGSIDEHSLGASLGFIRGDIITSVNDIPATSTAQRFKIYKTVVGLNPEEKIVMKFLRRSQGSWKEMEFTYTLQEVRKKAQKPRTFEPTENEKKQREIVAKKHTLAPTISDIRNRERQNMKEQGKKPTSLITPQS